MVGLLSFYRPVVVAANVTEFDPARKNADITLSGVNTIATVGSTNGDKVALAKDPILNGEKKAFSGRAVVMAQNYNLGIGISNLTHSLSSYLGSDTNSVGVYASGAVLFNGNLIGSVGAIVAGQQYDLHVDWSAKRLYVRPQGGLWNDSALANPTTGVGGIDISGLSGIIYPAVNLQTAGDQIEANFGKYSWTYPLASGFTAIALGVVIPADTDPDQFLFTDQTNAALNTTYTHAAVAITGLTGPSPFTVTGGLLRKNGAGSFVSSGTISNGDTIEPQVLSSAANSTASNCVVTIGTVSDTYTVTTLAAAGTGFAPATMGQSITTPDRADPGTTINLALRSSKTLGVVGGNFSQITVDSSTGFNVDDYIIVEVGAEAGLGQRGTTGVGGVWPNLGGDNWYHSAVAPRAYRGRITVKNGLILTVTPNFSTGTAAGLKANVYLDNTPIWNEAFASASKTNRIFKCPSGQFAFSAEINLDGCNNVIFEGNGITGFAWNTEIIQPKGSSHCQITLGSSSDSCTIRRLKHVSNHGRHGYSTEWSRGCWAYHSDNARLYDLEIWNAYQMASGFESGDGCHGWNIHIVCTEPYMDYIQWQLNIVDTNGNSFTDVFIDSVYMVQAFETFHTYDVIFRRIYVKNGISSTNSSGRLLIDDCHYWSTALNYFAGDSTTGGRASTHPLPGESIINVNNNLYYANHLYGDGTREYKAAQGVTIQNTSILAEGYARSNSDSWIGIEWQPAVLNGEITDCTYRGKGYNGTGNPACVALNAYGDELNNLVVDNYDVTRDDPQASNYSNIYNSGGTTRNCTAPIIQTQYDGGGNVGSVIAG